jgi:hypothetical protein
MGYTDSDGSLFSAAAPDPKQTFSGVERAGPVHVDQHRVAWGRGRGSAGARLRRTAVDGREPARQLCSQVSP